MYNSRVIESRLDRIVARGGNRAGPTRQEIDAGLQSASHLVFTPERSSIRTVIQNLRDIEEHYDPETGGILRPLSVEQRKWMANEVLWCRLDFAYFASRYAFIKDVNTGQLVRFQLNIAQRMILKILAEHDLESRAIELLFLKARQLGISTLSEILICHRVTFWPNTNAVIASSKPDQSDKMSEMMERVWMNMPGWMVPRKGAWVSARHGSGVFEFPGQNCGVSIQSGNQFTGISRGDTPDAYHMSELSEFEAAEELIDASLMKAVHPAPRTLGLDESTAKGKNNWFHDQWLNAKEEWPRGRSRLRPSFLPWFVGKDVWPTPTWVKDHPVPENWEPPEYVLRHAARARDYVLANDLLRGEMGSEWRMPVEQMWFYDIEYQQAKKKNSLHKFLEEMPADDAEAFQTTNISTFSLDTLEFYKSRRREPAAVLGLVGAGGEWPQKFQPSAREFAANGRRIPLRCVWGSAGEARFELVPLRFQGMSEEPKDGLGRIYVWEPPEKGEQYIFGVDTGDGLGEDRTVVVGVRKGSMGRSDAVVCEWASDYVNAFDLWPMCLALGSWYASVARDGRRLQPRMAIECKGNGESVQLELKKRGWSNFHPWVRYDNRRIEPAKAHKLGIYTNAWFRPLMMDMLVKWVRDGWIDIPSPYIIEELESLERDWDRQDSRAAYGAHDDRVMAVGFCLISAYGLEIKRAYAHPDGPDHAMGRLYQARGTEPEKSKAPRWVPAQLPGLVRR